MKKRLILALAVLVAALDASAQFDFRSTGTQTMTNLALNLSSAPAVAPTGKIVCYADSSTLTIKCSVNGGAYADIGAGVGGSGVSSVYGRSGAVVANSGDYLASQITATPHGTIAGTNVQTQLQQIDARISSSSIVSIFGRTGTVVSATGDYTASQITNVAAGSIASTSVQAAINELATEKADRTVATTVTETWTFNKAGQHLLLKPSSAPSANTKLLELRNVADSPLFSADYEGDGFFAGGLTVTGNLGVGTSPAAPLHVFTSGTSTTALGNVAGTLRSGASGRAATLQFSDTTNTAEIGVLGSALLFGTANTERMRLNSSGLGIGVTPTLPLQVSTSGSVTTAFGNVTTHLQSGATGRAVTSQFSDGTNTAQIGLLGSSLLLGTASTTRMSIDSTTITFPSSNLVTNTNASSGGAELRNENTNSTGSATIKNRATGANSVAEIINEGLGSASDALITVTAGNGTTSTRYALFQACSSETSAQCWSVGLHQNKNFTIFDETAFAARLVIDQSTGNVGIGANPSFRLHSISTTAPQVVAEHGASARTALAHDGTNGYIGTTTNQPLILVTNNTNRVTVGTTGNVTVTGTVTERGLSSPMGEWTAFAYAGGNFTTDTGTWTVASGDQVSNRFSRVGKTIFWNVLLNSTTVASSPTQLRITLPSGFTIGASFVAPVNAHDNGLSVSAYAQGIAGNSYVQVFKSDGTAWTTSTDATNVRFVVPVEIP